MIIRFFVPFIVLLCFSCKKEKTTTNTTKTTESSGITIPVGKGPDALYLSSDEKKLFVANVEDSTISVISTSTDQVISTLPSIYYPWGFTQLKDEREFAVSTYGGQIVVLNDAEDVLREKKFSHQFGGIVSDGDQALYVVSIATNHVLKIDAITLDSLEAYPVGNGPDGVAISEDLNQLYVTNTSDGTISKINLTTKQQELIQTGGKPELIHSNKDKSVLFVSNFTLNRVHVIQSNTGKILYEIKDLEGPEEAVLSQNETVLFVVNFLSSKVRTFNAIDYSLLSTTYSVGKNPIGVLSAKEDSKLYVSNYGDNSVTIHSIQ